jgi:hypothetical protein
VSLYDVARCVPFAKKGSAVVIEKIHRPYELATAEVPSLCYSKHLRERHYHELG